MLPRTVALLFIDIHAAGDAANHRHASIEGDAVAEPVLTGSIIRREFGDLLPGTVPLLLEDIRAAGVGDVAIAAIVPNHRHASIDGNAPAEFVSIIRGECGGLLPRAVTLLLVDIRAAGTIVYTIVYTIGPNNRHAT